MKSKFVKIGLVFCLIPIFQFVLIVKESNVKKDVTVIVIMILDPRTNTINSLTFQINRITELLKSKN
ncbi:MAG: hypothetical protein NPMRTH1_270032 [Nitrosopumilales archaeon]|nr:MAG: hypothetical protein NPMRTH1_270032 [Nitrosopumilales archaeon]